MSTDTSEWSPAPPHTPAPGALYTEVQQFYARHMQLLDAGEAELWAETFTVDGTFSVPTLTQPVRGREALVAAVRRTAAELAEAGTTHRHWHGMLDVTRQPDGRVRVRCYALVFATPRGGVPTLHRTCVCQDILVRVDGTLQVQHRRVTRDDLDG